MSSKDRAIAVTLIIIMIILEIGTIKELITVNYDYYKSNNPAYTQTEHNSESSSNDGKEIVETLKFIVIFIIRIIVSLFSMVVLIMFTLCMILRTITPLDETYEHPQQSHEQVKFQDDENKYNL